MSTLAPTVPTEHSVEVSAMSQEEIHLVQWEEWALSIEEHYHSQELFKRNPNGRPMGHR